MGAPASPSGSRPSDQARSGLGGSRFDPSRKPCEFPGSYAACQKCGPCLALYAKRAAVAAPHGSLIEKQSVRRCRMCNRIERYCQTDGQGIGRHAFAPVLTCESCRHFGGQYWGDSDNPIHHCGKSAERRRASFKSCGDAAEDFMREFRTFYDASPRYSAEGCAFFTAIATEARRAETLQDGSVHEGAGRETALPKGGQQ